MEPFLPPTTASTMTPSGVMIMNIVLTAVGVALGLFVNLRYSKMTEEKELAYENS